MLVPLIILFLVMNFFLTSHDNQKNGMIAPGAASASAKLVGPQPSIPPDQDYIQDYISRQHGTVESWIFFKTQS